MELIIPGKCIESKNQQLVRTSGMRIGAPERDSFPPRQRPTHCTVDSLPPRNSTLSISWGGCSPYATASMCVDITIVRSSGTLIGMPLLPWSAEKFPQYCARLQLLRSYCKNCPVSTQKPPTAVFDAPEKDVRPGGCSLRRSNGKEKMPTTLSHASSQTTSEISV